MLFWLFLFMMLFFAWRAFIYFNEERVLPCILAMLGCALFALGMYASSQRKSSQAEPQAQIEAQQTQSAKNVAKEEFDVGKLTLGQKLNLCGKKSYEPGVERAPRIEPEDQHKVSEFIQSGGCERAYAEFDSANPENAETTE